MKANEYNFSNTKSIAMFVLIWMKQTVAVNVEVHRIMRLKLIKGQPLTLDCESMDLVFFVYSLLV